jgi:hypothetical protein
MAIYAGTRTTHLYDRWRNKMSRVEEERIKAELLGRTEVLYLRTRNEADDHLSSYDYGLNMYCCVGKARISP